MNVFAQKEEGGSEECVVGDDGQCIAEASSSTPVTCRDKEKDCNLWESEGECPKNPKFMLENCPKACGVCGKSQDEVNQLIEEYDYENQRVAREMRKLIENYGVDQNIPSGDTEAELIVQSWWKTTAQYMENVVYKDERYSSVEQDACLNLHPDCTLWASLGECQKNPGPMTAHCRPACRMCHTLLASKK